MTRRLKTYQNQSSGEQKPAQLDQKLAQLSPVQFYEQTLQSVNITTAITSKKLHFLRDTKIKSKPFKIGTISGGDQWRFGTTMKISSERTKIRGIFRISSAFVAVTLLTVVVTVLVFLRVVEMLSETRHRSVENRLPNKLDFTSECKGARRTFQLKNLDDIVISLTQKATGYIQSLL